MEYSVIGIIIFIAYICFVVWAYFKEEAEKNTSPITDTSSFDLKDLEGLDTLLRGCQIQANASYDSVKINKHTEAQKDWVLLFDAVAHGFICACLKGVPDRDFIKTNTAFEYYKTAMDKHGVGDYGGAGGFEERKEYLIDKGALASISDIIEYGSTSRFNELISLIKLSKDENQTKPIPTKYKWFDEYINAYTKESGNLIPYKLNSSYQEILSK